MNQFGYSSLKRYVALLDTARRAALYENRAMGMAMSETLVADLLNPFQRMADAGLRRLLASQYRSLIEVGGLPEGPHFELLDGFVVVKDRRDTETEPVCSEIGEITHGPKHAFALLQLAAWIGSVMLSGKCHLRQQTTIELNQSCLPEPDACLVMGSPRDYLNVLPTRADVLWICEVASASLASDRNIKRVLYAQAGVPVYWIIDIAHQQVLVYRQPDSDLGDYAIQEVHSSVETISLTVSDMELIGLHVADLFV
jgi:Uma2 family endonuclease